MKSEFLLSDLIEYRNVIEAFDLDHVHQHARHELDKLLHALMNHPKIRFKKRHQTWHDASRVVDRSFESFGSALVDLKIHLRNLISEYHDQYLAASLQWFQEEMPYETNDYRLNRRMQIQPDDLALLMGRIRRWTDWHVPGMILGPGLEGFIDSLVSLDPLYLVDQNQDLLEPALARFNANYQRRLRTYAVREFIGQPLLQHMPDEQFGFCFAYNFFNFKPLELVQQYLEELFFKIRPGGSILFTFNDCDLAHGVALCERHFACYTPGAAIRKIAGKIGFVINHQHQGSLDVAWIELGKPGSLRSIRGGQTLARIVANNNR